MTWHILWYDNISEKNSDFSTAKEVSFLSPWLISIGKCKRFRFFQVGLFKNSNILKKRLAISHIQIYLFLSKQGALLMRSFLLCNYWHLTQTFWIPSGQIISKYARELASQIHLFVVIPQPRQLKRTVSIPSFLELQCNFWEKMKELF